MDELAELERYLVHLSATLGHADRHVGLRGYCAGLMSPVARKSVEPMAAAVDPQHVRSRHQSLHHFVADSEGRACVATIEPVPTLRGDTGRGSTPSSHR